MKKIKPAKEPPPKVVIRKRPGQEPVRVTRMSRSRISETIFNGNFPL